MGILLLGQSSKLRSYGIVGKEYMRMKDMKELMVFMRVPIP